MKTLRIELSWTPRHYQLEAARRRRLRNVLVWHRRAGKTEFCAGLLLTEMLRHPGLYWYIAPYRNQARRILWDRLKSLARRLITTGIVQVREVEMALATTGGGRIELHGADHPDALRGVGLRGVVYDEVAQMEPTTWEEVTLPALADQPGAWEIFIGTPKGLNHFKDLYDRAVAEMEAGGPSYASLLTVDDTGVIDRGFLERAKRIMTRAAFMQEFYCVWDAGGVSLIDPADVAACELAEAGDPRRYANGTCVVGVDLAVRGDLTVAVVLERTGPRWILREMLERRNVPLLEQVEDIARIMRDYRVSRLVVDRTGLGEAVVETLERRWGGVVDGVIMTPQRRIELVQDMRLAFAERRIAIPPHDGLRRDLAGIRLDWTNRGQPRLEIDRAGGSHADRAMALALAVSAIGSYLPGAEIATAGLTRPSAMLDDFIGGL